MDTKDIRNIACGLEIPTETYSDQPYVVIADDGAWVCVLTTGVGKEGEPGQHVITTRSLDRGKTWEKPVDVEPADGPESSYAVLLKGPDGRLYCFYNHNTDNRRYVRADNPPYPDGKCYRVDSQGHFVFKVSDDHGKSWSAQRYEIPQRNMDIDRKNPYGGEIRYFWNVGRAFALDGGAYVPLHKVGGFGIGFFTRSEGVLLHSPNLLTARDPAQARWETLPDGDFGLRTPPGGGPIAEEQCCVPLSDGSLFCVYRTVDGHAACAYSRDKGHTWSEPAYMRFADGRLMKHPRAANFVWRLKNGKYVYWFHNHGLKSYDQRNPVWVSGGVERETPRGLEIAWSEPEILLYDDDAILRMSYPDLVEEADGALYFTETQKDKARVHPVDRTLLEGMWGQGADRPAPEGAILRLDAMEDVETAFPRLPEFNVCDREAPDLRGKDLRSGFTIGCTVQVDAWQDHGVLLSTLDAAGRGFVLAMGENRRLTFTMSDGMTTNVLYSDPIVADGAHRVTVIVDGGPKVMMFVIDGKLSTGGEARPFGWARFSPELLDAGDSNTLRRGSLAISRLYVYGRALRVSEAVALQRAE